MTAIGERFRSSTSVKDWLPGSLRDTPPPITAWYAAYWASDPLFTPGLTDGAQVSSWRDFSGNGRAVAQATSGFRPLFRGAIAGLNGKRAVEFDRVDDYLQLIGLGPLSQPTEFVIVGRFTSTTVVNVSMPIFDSASASNRQTISSGGAASALSLFAGSSISIVAPSPTTTDTLGHFIHLDFNGATSVAGVDLASVVTLSSTVGTQTLDGLTLGNRYDGSRPSGYQFAFLGVMNRALTGAERQSMLNWSRALYATP